MESHGSEHEIVYILVNAAMPGLVKIGKTTQKDVSDRMRQLYTTGVPVPFEYTYACRVRDCSNVERRFHEAFADMRVNPNREFFRIDAEKIKAVLELVAEEDVTPQIAETLLKNVSKAGQESVEKLKAKRPTMNFEEMGIPAGATLRFRDGEQTVTVTNARRVEMNGSACSLTAATREARGIDYDVAPSPYWSYEDKLRKDIYDETYTLE